jgi:diacylglycerol kinase (ATP)
MAPSKCTVLWNPHARSAGDMGKLRDQLESRQDVELHVTESPTHTRQLAKESAAEGDHWLVAAGGDGTLNTVINGICERRERPTLGILPLGTGNDLARTLNIPLDPHEAAELIFEQDREPITMDLVDVQSATSHRVFANVCGGGNSQRVTECLDSEAKRRWGPWSYLRGAVDVLRDLKGFDVTIRFDDGDSEKMQLWNVIIANGNVVAGGLPVAPQADISDGLMDVILVKDGAALDVATLSVEFFLGDYLQDERVIFRRIRKLEIDAADDMPFAADGEAIESPPLTFSVRSGALRVLRGE